MNLAKLAEAVKAVQDDSKRKQFVDLLSMLKAQYALYYSAHWRSSGPMAYERHLLFERLYGALPGQFDGLAEKMVQLYGNEVVDPVTLSEGVSGYLKSWTTAEDCVECGLKAEEELQAALKQLSSKDVSIGMSNFLQGIADAHETHLYLLGQLKSK